MACPYYFYLLFVDLLPEDVDPEDFDSPLEELLLPDWLLPDFPEDEDFEEEPPDLVETDPEPEGTELLLPVEY